MLFWSIFIEPKLISTFALLFSMILRAQNCPVIHQKNKSKHVNSLGQSKSLNYVVLLETAETSPSTFLQHLLKLEQI